MDALLQDRRLMVQQGGGGAELVFTLFFAGTGTFGTNYITIEKDGVTTKYFCQNLTGQAYGSTDFFDAISFFGHHYGWVSSGVSAWGIRALVPLICNGVRYEANEIVADNLRYQPATFYFEV